VAWSGGSGSFLTPDELVCACTAPGVPGLVPHPAQSLALVPGWVLGQLQASRRGVIVLGVDGLSWSLAASCWHAAELACLTSTFPTTSATAWLTALTGVGPAQHLAAANSYLVPTLGTVINAVTAQPIAWQRQPPPTPPRQPVSGTTDQLLVPHPTLFEHATQQGATCVAVTRELDGRLGFGQPAQPGEPVRVSGVRHHAGQVAVGPGERPRQAGPDHIPADEHQQP
jgi:hypothetical protein